MKPWYIIILITMCTLSVFAYYFTHPLVSKVRIHNATFTIYVAVTETQKQLGLGKRQSMPSQSGMVFLYDHSEQFEFWMKDMMFPLDFVWIRDKTVVDLTENIPPPTQNEIPQIVKPSVPVDTVLELNAGSIQRFGIATGDAVQFLDR